MTEPDAKASMAGSQPVGPVKPERPPNPVWRMMGLPNIRMKLPSRNWLIFLSITGSWTAAVMYDRREKKRIQKKWAKVVEHIAQEPLDTHQLPRKVTVFLSAPPMDGIVAARDHFHEYVKPILVAAALDWDAIEGRKEGDVRAGLAERIRKLRKKRGEASNEPIEEGLEETIEGLRQRAGVHEWSGPAGDLVIGRHTWKEYVRGLHEGWLGPIDSPLLEETSAETTVKAPATPVEVTPAEAIPQSTLTPTDTLAELKTVHTSTDDASPAAEAEPLKTDEVEKPKEEENKPKKKKQPPPFITTTDYENATLSPYCPQALGPSAAIPLPHLLGFFNFPIRMYRFLNRRQVADAVGRETAAVVLGVYRPFETAGEESEQQQLLVHEEPDWHKTAKKREEGETKERTWLDDMVLDPRVAERMRKFALDADAEHRARNFKPTPEPWFGSLWSQEKQKGAWEGLSED